jgi:hypothetical protein
MEAQLVSKVLYSTLQRFCKRINRSPSYRPTCYIPLARSAAGVKRLLDQAKGLFFIPTSRHRHHGAAGS